ncbi:MAG: PQQ-binding-like beta-propeller repeat protein [Bryobacterales bacterium]|nr:PQQ-binding-like beta-propeller repeat protein [Bryobacterales bacterium]
MTRNLVLKLAIGATCAWAQRGADWMTSGFDAQRSHWVRNDGKISAATMSKPGFELVWKAKLTNGARGLETSTPPALLDFYISYRGFRALGFFGTALDRVVAYDIDLGRLEWEKQWGKLTPGGGNIPCPGGMTAAVTRPTILPYPPVPTGGGAGRGNPAKSAVGEPYEGAVTLKRALPSPPVAPPKPAAAAKPAAPAPSPYAARILYVLALSGDGKLHSMWVSNGNETDPAVQFVPPNARAAGLVSVDGIAYVATTNACSGVPDGVWALDVATKSVTKWLSKGMFGGAGPAIAPDGTVYAAGGDGQLTALAGRTLEKKSAYQAGAEFTSSPVLFEHQQKDFAALTTKDGRLHVIDTTTMSGQKSEPFSAGYEAGALASWQDPKGRRWILAPSNKSIVAFEVSADSAIRQVWESRELISPATPVIVNGVVFALSTGEHRTGTATERVKQSKNAVLYALDAATGKELWNSGTTINGFVHSGGLSAGGGRVYVATNDGTQYVFAFPMEH